MIPEISGNPALKKRVDRAWQKAEREWQRKYKKECALPAQVFWQVWRTLFNELPGVECALTKDAVVDFEEWVNANEVQRAIDALNDALDLAESQAALLRAAASHSHGANGESGSSPGTRRGPYRTPLERRLELIRFVWDQSGAFTDLHLVFGCLGYEAGSIEWRTLWEKWNREKPARPMANPGQLRDEFRRITSKSKYEDTVRAFFVRLDREIRALAVLDAERGKHFTESAAMMHMHMERRGQTPEGETE